MILYYCCFVAVFVIDEKHPSKFGMLKTWYIIDEIFTISTGQPDFAHPSSNLYKIYGRIWYTPVTRTRQRLIVVKLVVTMTTGEKKNRKTHMTMENQSLEDVSPIETW